MRYRVWYPDMPEPKPETIVLAETIHGSFKMRWEKVREDALSGYAVVLLEEND
jgi:hypothetical protein